MQHQEKPKAEVSQQRECGKRWRSKKAVGSRPFQGSEGEKEVTTAEMQKEAKMVRCTWVMRRYKGALDIFFGVERRIRKHNKEAKKGWRLAVDAARIKDENAGIEDRKHTSGVFCGCRQWIGSSYLQRRGSSCVNPRKRRMN